MIHRATDRSVDGGKRPISQAARCLALEPNGGDEYCLEAALRLTEAHGGDVTLLTMGPAAATDAVRKTLAMGAARAVLVSDPALVGACVHATGRVLAAALR